MKVKSVLLICLMLIVVLSCKTAPEGKNLFILSGQSNMARLNLEESFIPTIEAKFGKENVLFAKHATGGRSIRRWYKNWKPPVGDQAKAAPDLYDSLMVEIQKVIQKEKISTVTFLWMQGERDANSKYGEVYEESLKGLYKQLSNDLGRTDVNFVIGRLSDFDMLNEKYGHWVQIRDIQVKVAASNPRFDWVDTDDLNDGINSEGIEVKNDLHMSKKGYKIMGERFANKSIDLIEKNK